MVYLSVVIPLLNEETLIEELVVRVESNLKLITNDFEIILVDDGSNDSTWEKIQQFAGKNTRIKALKFSRNFGHHYALTAGLHSSNGEWTVVMDGDLQDRPEVIHELLSKALEGYEVVFVSRRNRPESLAYKIVQKIYYKLLRILSGFPFDSSQANFSIIHRKVVEAFKLFPENARFYGSTILWLGFKRTSIEAEHGRRHSGKASYTLRKRFKLAIEIILAFSVRPLRIAIGLGLLVSILSLMFGFYLIIKSVLMNETLIGIPFLTVSLFLTFGVILIFLGFIGLYLGQVFREVKNRPLYIVSDKLNL